MTQTIKIGSMNILGLSNRAKRLDIFNWLNIQNFSIYCLQDIHVGPKYESSFKQDWGHDAVIIFLRIPRGGNTV